MYVPQIIDSHENVVIYMITLYEARIINIEANDPNEEEICKIKFEKEPSNIKINYNYIIGIFNTEFIVYKYRDYESDEILKTPQYLYNKDLNASIQNISLNDDFIISFIKGNIVVDDIHEGNFYYNFVDQNLLS